MMIQCLGHLKLVEKLFTHFHYLNIDFADFLAIVRNFDFLFGSKAKNSNYFSGRYACF